MSPAGMQSPLVGRGIPRLDGDAKLTGVARFISDYSFAGMLYGRTVRSPAASGTIRRLALPTAADGFTTVDFRDIPGRNVVALIADDQPCLAERVVRHVAEPVALVAHADLDRLARATVNVSVDETSPMLDYERSTIDMKTLRIVKGDVDAAMAGADVIVEGEYRTPHQEQLYIEPNGMVAVPDGTGLTVYGSMQCPFYVKRALCEALAMSPDRVGVVPVTFGGGFGGKEEYPSILACHAALLALKAGRPVKMIYDRAEDMLATTKRHPFRVRHRTGLTRDGRIVAMDIDILVDGGAYITLTPVVLSRGALHATGPYRCDHVRISGRAVMTNTPPNGAFRGFGATQTQFAAEVHMERIAEALGIDGVRLREINALRSGDSSVTGGLIGEDCAALDVLQEAVRRSRYREKRAEYRGTNRGIGLSLFFHGGGFTGDGERRLASRAALDLTGSGVRVRTSAVEIGQGVHTIHAQIVAEALGIPIAAVTVAEPDTRRVPDSGPTVASRTCMVVGRLLQRCATELLERLGGRTLEEHFRLHGALTIEHEYDPPAGLSFDEGTYRGDAYGAYSWACDVVEVELDPDTYVVRPRHVTAVHEAGRIINPLLARGQVEGGTAQGLGYALLEEVVMHEGSMANASMTDYLIPTASDVPRMDVALLERTYAHGPYGAKGLGELPINGPAPAVVNAIRHLGIDLRALPVTPERVMEAKCGSS